MGLLPEWAPNIHPMLVHFPLAIFFFAALMDLLTFFLDKKWWDEKKTAVTYLIGAVAAVTVFFTGEMAADSIDIPKAAYHAVGEHAGWAEWTVWFFAIYAVVRIIMSAMDKLKQTKWHVTFFVLSLVGLFFLYETGEHGAKLVFNYGLGTGHQQVEKKESPMAGGFSQDSTGWNWMVNASAPKIFKKQFKVLASDTSGQLQVVEQDSGRYLKVDGEKTFFASAQDYSNFEFDVTLEADSLSGDLMLVHHVQDANNYDFMVLHQDGSASLGRMRNGSSEIIEQGKADWNNADHFRFVNSGEHQRGYVDGELILHGHVEAAPAGGVGLKTDGQGKLLIRKMSLSKLSGEHHEDEEHHHEEGEEHHEEEEY